MDDGIIKGVGNSRFLKSVPSFLSLYPTYEAFAEALVAGTLPIDLNGINEAGWSQLGTPLNKANLLSDETAAALGLKTHKVEKAVGDYAAGETVYLKEDGVMVPFTVLEHDYQSDLNGTGRTLLIRQGAAGVSVWNESGVNTYADSTVDVYLNETYKIRLDEAVQTAMGTTSFPSGDGNGASTVSTLSRAVFLLSGSELGMSYNPADGTKLSLLTGTDLKGSDLVYGGWTRSSVPGNTTSAYILNPSNANAAVTGEYSVYPCFTLPANYQIVYYENGNGRVHDQPFDITTPSAALEALSTMDRGQELVIEGTMDADAALSLKFPVPIPGWYKVVLEPGSYTNALKMVAASVTISFDGGSTVSGNYSEITARFNIPSSASPAWSVSKGFGSFSWLCGKKGGPGLFFYVNRTSGRLFGIATERVQIFEIYRTAPLGVDITFNKSASLSGSKFQVYRITK